MDSINLGAPLRSDLSRLYVVHNIKPRLAQPGRRFQRKAATTFSLKLHDPSFLAPIYANLLTYEGGDGYTTQEREVPPAPPD
ncbi:hypothetical protein Bra471DRAFT_01755 [Bradyrhizobium sp. WSM471]|nr:hypothetical protein Bra471DRAFT_01755 [Bradyrhizobium sp. WSM471]